VWDGQPLDGATPADRCRLVLLDDASLSNAEVARLADAKPAQAGDVRRRLTGLGVLAPQRVVTARFPQHAPLPRSPRILAEGACVGVMPSPWVSDDPAQRTHARVICITQCHVAGACLAWALRAVPVDDSAIYAGTGPSERRALRAQLGLRRPHGVVAINAAKTCCPECGLPLSGENLITEPGRRPGTVRRRCRACTRARKAAAYARHAGAAS
jgi:Transcription factor WhiB